LVVLLGSSFRPEVSSFEEARKWFLESIQIPQTLPGLPRHVLRLFLEIEDLFHVLLGEGTTGRGVSLPRVDLSLCRFLIFGRASC